HDVGVIVGDVVALADVLREIEELRVARLQLRLRTAVEFLEDELPVADADARLAAVAGRFAVEEGTRLLLLAEQRGSHADAVDARGRRGFIADEIEQRGHPVLESAHAIARAAGGDMALPAHDGRLADAALEHRALAPVQRAGAPEKFRVGAAELPVERTVVAGEDEDGAFVEAEF